MFDRIFGEYLRSTGRLTDEQLADVLEIEANEYTRLGVIAVSEKIMTNEQTEEINHMQATSDRRFGDIAVEKGYLTSTQLDSLLKRQGNSFFHFLQAIINKGYYTLEELDEFVEEYHEKSGLTYSEMDALVSGDVMRVVNVYLPHQDRLYGRLCGIAVRTFLRLIDSRAYIERAYTARSFEADRFACQKSFGTHSIMAGFAGDGDALLSMAETFGREEFGEVNLDALDSVAEFTNCIDGLFSTEIYSEGVDVDMTPPQLYDRRVSVSGQQLCIVPIVTKNKKIFFIMALDTVITVKEI